MATCVLVHGGFVGSSSWRFVRPALRAAGHDVFAPSMSGWSDREHVGGEHVGLSTNILDIQRLIEYEDLHDVTLIGHSYGGMVISAVAGRVPDRLRHLVYLDGFLPEEGKSLLDYFDRNLLTIDGWRVEPPAFVAPFGPGVTAQPLLTLDEPLHYPAPLESYSFARTYIKALQPPRGEMGSTENYWQAYDMAQSSTAWNAASYEGHHFSLLTEPEVVTRALLGVI
jgi:pimeloyl-ACP methyl ester carboxylesterase